MKYTFKQFNTYAALSEEERTQEKFDEIFPETLDEGVIDDIAQKAGEVVGKVAKVVGIKSELEKSREKLKAAQEKRAAAKKAMDAKLKNIKSFDDKAKDLKNKIGYVGAAIEKDRAALKRATMGKYSDSQFAKDLIAQQNESFIEVLNAVVEGYINIDEFITEAKADTVYEITQKRNGRESKQTGTLEELIDEYSYELETGQSYEREKGNKKINVNPKTIKALIDNLSKAVDNAAANGYSGVSFSYKEITPKESVTEGWEKQGDPENKSQYRVKYDRKGVRVKTPEGEGEIEYEARNPTFSQMVPFSYSVYVKLDGTDKAKEFPREQVRVIKAKKVEESVAEFLEALRDEVMEEFSLSEDQVQTIDGLVVDKVECFLENASTQNDKMQLLKTVTAAIKASRPSSKNTSEARGVLTYRSKLGDAKEDLASKVLLPMGFKSVKKPERNDGSNRGDFSTDTYDSTYKNDETGATIDIIVSFKSSPATLTIYIS